MSSLSLGIYLGLSEGIRAFYLTILIPQHPSISVHEALKGARISDRRDWTMLTSKSHVFVMAAALGAMLSAPLAVADTVRSQPRTQAQEQIAERLDDFKYTAASMRNEIDGYASSVRSNNLQYQSHAYNLNSAREQVNALGAKLSELERLSPQGTELQRTAIREAKASPSCSRSFADHPCDAQ